jgi:hypothetical protein
MYRQVGDGQDFSKDKTGRLLAETGETLAETEEAGFYLRQDRQAYSRDRADRPFLRDRRGFSRDRRGRLLPKTGQAGF